MKDLGCKQSLQPGIFLSRGVRRADLKNLLGLPLCVCVSSHVPSVALLLQPNPVTGPQNDKARLWCGQEGLRGSWEGVVLMLECGRLSSYYLCLVSGSLKSQGKCTERGRVEEAKVPESGMEVWGVDPRLACLVTQ